MLKGLENTILNELRKEMIDIERDWKIRVFTKIKKPSLEEE